MLLRMFIFLKIKGTKKKVIINAQSICNDFCMYIITRVCLSLHQQMRSFKDIKFLCFAFVLVCLTYVVLFLKSNLYVLQILGFNRCLKVKNQGISQYYFYFFITKLLLPTSLFHYENTN